MAISPPRPKTTLPSPFSSLLSQPFSHYSLACEKLPYSDSISGHFSLSLKITFFTLCLNSETSSPPLDWHPLPLPHWQLHYCHFGDHWLDQSHPQSFLAFLFTLKRKILINQPTILWEEDTSKSCWVVEGVFLWQAGRENTWGQYFQLRQHEDGRKHTHFSIANISTWKISPLYQ